MADLRFRLAALLLAVSMVPVAPAAAVPAADLARRAYVQGRFAAAEQDYALAASEFARALKADPGDAIRRQALEVALLRGDLKQVAILANAIDLASHAGAVAIAVDPAVTENDAENDAADDTDEDSAEDSAADHATDNFLILLIRVADAARRADRAAYTAALHQLEDPARQTSVSPVVVPILAAYGDVAGGQTDAALARLDPAQGAGHGAVQSYLAEHRAHVLAIAGRWAEAAIAYEQLALMPGAGLSRLRVAAASSALQAAREDPDHATVWRDRAIAWLGGGAADDPLLMAARARLMADSGRTPAPTPVGVPRTMTDGLAQAFVRLSADFGRGGAERPALVMARLATLLAPGASETWLVTAEQLTRDGQYPQALAALDQAGGASGAVDRAGDGWQPLIAARRVTILRQMGRTAEARALLEARTQDPDAGVIDWLRLADLEREASDLAAAGRAYGQALALLPADADSASARIHFRRGSMIDTGGTWADAEADLRAAVRLQPDNAVYLNYLGYSLLDHGDDAVAARQYIARAYEGAPDNGAIIDSMGWLEFREGNFGEAVRLLEMAYAAEPADPTIADHLGDALWRAGRRIEARHAWTSARQLNDDGAAIVRIADKLAYGLPGAGRR